MRRTPRGQMNKSITFQTVTKSNTMAGGGGETVTTLFNCMAKVRPIRAREAIASDRPEMEITHQINCDYDSRVTGKKRISYDSRTLEIVALIDIDEQGIEFEILPKELAA